MNRFLGALTATILCSSACGRTGENSRPAAGVVADSATRTVLNSAGSAHTTDRTFDPGMFRDAPDSNTYSWAISPDDRMESRFTGRHIRHPSGLLMVWFDTATRATEDQPAGQAHVDSVVANGLRPGEFLAYHCNTEGKHEHRVTGVIGVVHDTIPFTQPRLAWVLDTASYRIRTIPTDSVLCSGAPIFSDDVDD